MTISVQLIYRDGCKLCPTPKSSKTSLVQLHLLLKLHKKSSKILCLIFRQKPQVRKVLVTPSCAISGLYFHVVQTNESTGPRGRNVLPTVHFDALL